MARRLLSVTKGRKDNECVAVGASKTQVLRPDSVSEQVYDDTVGAAKVRASALEFLREAKSGDW